MKPRSRPQKNSVLITFVFFIFLAVFICFYNLGGVYFENWDEAWYAEMTKQMLATKEFILLRWNKEFIFDKPPLYIWLSVFVSSVLGLSEFSVRFTSALSGFLIILMVLVYSYKKWGFLPSLLSFVTISLNNIFVWRTRSGNLDVFAAFLIFNCFFLILSQNKHRYLFLGLVFGLLYLTKTSLVFFPATIFVLHEIIFHRKNIKKNFGNYIKLFFLFIVIPGLWLFLGFLKQGKPFLTYYLFKSDQGVAQISLNYFKLDYWLYTYYSLQRRFFYLFLLGLLFLIFRINLSRNFLLFMFSTALLVLLTFTERKNNWYLIPAMPYWSLVIGYAIYKVLNLFQRSRLIILPILLLTIYTSYKTLVINIQPIFYNSSVNKQVESAKRIKELTKKEDIVVRLDHLYPTTIYYSNRKVLSSPSETGDSDVLSGLFIGRGRLLEMVKGKKIKWISGKSNEVDLFLKANRELSFERIKVNNEEEILKVL